MQSSVTTSTTASKSNFGQKFFNFYHSQKYVDCSFQIDDQIVMCHKLILSTSSPVFEAMFYGPMSSSSSSSAAAAATTKYCNNGDDCSSYCIQITDINYETFKFMIEYIYTGELDFNNIQTIDTIIELYYSGEKYLINDLIYDCLKEIKKKLHYTNILEALDCTLYMRLEPLLQILLNFFHKTCLQKYSYEFIENLDKYYYHISRDCLKLIIHNIEKKEQKREQNKGQQQEEKQMMTMNSSSSSGSGNTKINNFNNNTINFIRFWCKNECKQLGLNENEYHSQILKELNVNYNTILNNNSKDYNNSNNNDDDDGDKILTTNCFYIERRYFKALRPFVISEENCEFSTKLKSDHFIQLLGFTMHCRILPRIFKTNSNTCYGGQQQQIQLCNGGNYYHHYNNNNNNDRNRIICLKQNNNNYYKEQFDIHIWANDCVLIHRQKCQFTNINYNCNMNVQLYKQITIAPGSIYKIKIKWNEISYGAEYPLCLYSNKAKGIQFEQEYFHNYDGGSIFKGIRYINQI